MLHKPIAVLEYLDTADLLKARKISRDTEKRALFVLKNREIAVKLNKTIKIPIIDCYLTSFVKELERLRKEAKMPFCGNEIEFEKELQVFTAVSKEIPVSLDLVLPLVNQYCLEKCSLLG